MNKYLFYPILIVKYCILFRLITIGLISMKNLLSLLLLTFLILILGACSSTSPFYQNLSSLGKASHTFTKVAPLDFTLPQISSNKLRYISDLSAIAFEWDIPKDDRVAGYAIYRSDVDEKTPRKLTELRDRHITHFVDKQLAPNTIYLYQFATISQENKESQKSDIKAVSTLERLAPIPYAVALSDLPRKVKVIWRPHPSERITKYILYKKVDLQWNSIAEIDNRLSVEYIDTKLQDNAQYHYRVTAVAFDGTHSANSAVISATTKAPPPRIATLLATKQYPGEIQLSWSTDAKDIAYFALYRSNNIKQGYKLLQKTKQTSYLDKTKQDGAIYFYKVAIVDTEGLHGDINSLSGTFGQSLAKPVSPIITLATHDTQSNKIIVRWDSNDNRIIKYHLVRSVKNNAFSLVQKQDKQITKDLTQKEWIEGNVMYDATYTYQIIGIDSNNIESLPSVSASIVTPKNR